MFELLRHFQLIFCFRPQKNHFLFDSFLMAEPPLLLFWSYPDSIAAVWFLSLIVNFSETIGVQAIKIGTIFKGTWRQNKS